jgi:hypothetical protein
MSEEGRSYWTLGGIAAVIAALTGVYVAMKPSSAPAPTPVPGPVPGLIVVTPPATATPPKMGSLQQAIDFTGYDLNPGVVLRVPAPENCAQLCLEDNACKAMSYMYSNGTCWLKKEGATAVNRPGMVSAMKLR